jgi:glycine cleavage system aminomethyltransferase T
VPAADRGPFDMALVQRGARLRRSPYFEATQRHGPTGFTVYNHTLFPIAYDDPVEEYWHLLEHVTLWDVAVERNLEVSGRDGARFAQLLTCRDLSQVEPGQARYVLITAPDGGIVNDPVMLRLDEDTFWFALADSDVHLYAMGLAAHAGLDVDIALPEAYPLQIQGPRSREVVGDLFGAEVADLAYYTFTHTAVAGIPVIVTRTGWSAEVGYEVYLREGARGTELWDLIMAAGAAYDIRPTGPSDIRRIEGGILNWGADMDETNDPFQVGLGRLVDLDVELPFMGKEALRRIRDEGVDRRLVGIEIAGEPLDLNQVPWPVEVGGEGVGRVTSAVHSPRLRRNIGYAWVPSSHAEDGSSLTVVTPHGAREATVVTMPFVDPGKRIPRA